MSKLTLVAVVQAIISQAEEIEKLSMFQQPAAAKALLKDEIVPLLLTMSEKLDGLKGDTELKQLEDLFISHGKRISALEAQVKKLTKPATTKAAE